MRLFLLLAFLSAMPSQSVRMPVRIGFATALTEQDLAAINVLLPEKPWLLTGDPAQYAITEFVDAYLPPTTSTALLRRGTEAFVSRRIDIRTHKPTGEWTAARQPFQWAQVAIPMRAFEDIQHDLDLNRPFRVVGQFDDDELISLVTFLRSNARNDGDLSRTVQLWPILTIKREQDGSVEVSLREKRLTGQSLDLRQTGQDWIIIRFGRWGA
jgi:hypothetical protein